MDLTLYPSELFSLVENIENSKILKTWPPAVCTQQLSEPTNQPTKDLTEGGRPRSL
jgi:hypothetical protein